MYTHTSYTCQARCILRFWSRDLPFDGRKLDGHS